MDSKNKTVIGIFSDSDAGTRELPGELVVTKAKVQTTTLGVTVAGKPIHLTEREARILDVLVGYNDRVIPIEALAEQVLLLDLEDSTWKAEAVQAVVQLRGSLGDGFCIEHREGDELGYSLTTEAKTENEIMAERLGEMFGLSKEESAEMAKQVADEQPEQPEEHDGHTVVVSGPTPAKMEKVTAGDIGPEHEEEE